MIAGLLGVPLGSFLGQKLRVRYQRADPIVCGMGMLFSTPLMLAALFIAGWNTTTCFVVVFFGQVLLNLNWAIVADILLVCDALYCFLYLVALCHVCLVFLYFCRSIKLFFFFTSTR